MRCVTRKKYVHWSGHECTRSLDSPTANAYVEPPAVLMNQISAFLKSPSPTSQSDCHRSQDQFKSTGIVFYSFVDPVFGVIDNQCYIREILKKTPRRPRTCSPNMSPGQTQITVIWVSALTCICTSFWTGDLQAGLNT